MKPDTQQIFKLSDYFGKLANIVGDYIDFNKGNMVREERNRLYDLQIDLARFAGEINIFGVNLIFEDVRETLNELEHITEKVKAAVKKALAVQKAINIAAALVTIGSSILSKDPKAIIKSTTDFAKTLS